MRWRGLGWEREIEGKGLPVQRGEIWKKKQGKCVKRVIREKWANDRGEARIRYLNEHEGKKERRGGRERQ